MKKQPLKDLYIRIESLSVGVTGSCNYLLFHQPDGQEEQILIDCGLFFDKKELELNREFSFDCKKIKAVFVTHEHTDHCARIPCLYNKGFSGKVYASKCAIQKIKSDAMSNFFGMRRDYNPVLYEENDAIAMIKNCSELEVNQKFELTSNISITPLPNAHTEGAVMYMIEFSYEDRVVRTLFTGDYKCKGVFGKSHFPIQEDKFDKPVTVITESTHGGKEQPERIFKKEVQKAIFEDKHVIVIATGNSRWVTISNEIKQMKKDQMIPQDLQVFFDFKKNFNTGSVNLFTLPSNVTFVKNAQERKQAIYEKRDKIIIATSRGAADFYLQELLDNSKYAIFFTNFVAKGSRIDRILTTPPGQKIILAGKEFVKTAYMKKTEEYSDHDFSEGLIDMLNSFTSINGILLEHGEDISKDNLKKKIMIDIPKSKIFKLKRGKAFKITEAGVKGTAN